MQSPPRLFDTDLLRQRRARAAAMPADFLHAAAAAEVSERLREVNRRFHTPAIVGPRPEVWAEALATAGAPVARRVPDAETLDLAEGAHDLVLHALALHWANDPVGQLVQMRRALQPDGLMIAALFGGETLGELRTAFAEAELTTLDGISPRVAPMGEIRALGALLQRAGFALPVADSLRFDVTYASPLALMRDLRAMGETNVLADRMRRPLRRDTLAGMGESYTARFGLADGRVPACFEVIFLTGWAPAASQQQPLRPGSARVRLADALGTVEHGSGSKPGDAPD